MFQALLQGICLQTFDTSFPPVCILQPFCGIGKRSSFAADHLHLASVLRYMYRYQLRGFHPASCMP